MGYRFSPLGRCLLVLAAVALMSGRCWAHYYDLGPSKDEWGLKYDGNITAAGNNLLNVSFKISDHGRLAPVYSVTVIAFTNPARDGSRSYALKAPIIMKPTPDGKVAGEVQVDRQLAERAVVRIMTLTVDGKSVMTGPAAGARYYDIPLRKLVKKAPMAAAPPARGPVASPPASIASPPATGLTR